MKAISARMFLMAVLALSASADPDGQTLAGGVVIQGDSRQRAAIVSTLDRIERSPTGASRAQSLAKLGETVEVSFGEFEGSTITVIDGQRRIMGGPGRTHVEAGAEPRVILNRLYLQADPDWARADMPKVLAHELLGHALESLEAQRAGVADAYQYFVDNETNASAVEWVVSTELGDAQADLDERLFVQNLAGYRRRKQLALPYYAETFSLAEFADPLSVLQGRRHWADGQAARLKRAAESVKRWRSYIGHLLARHRGQTLAGVTIRKEAFAWLAGAISRRLDDITRQEHRVDRVREKINQRLAYYGDDAGRQALRRQQESIAAESGAAFFKQGARKLEDLRNRLIALKPKFTVKRSAPAPSGQVSWDALKRIYQADLLVDPQLMVNGLSGLQDADWAGLPAWQPERH